MNGNTHMIGGLLVTAFFVSFFDLSYLTIVGGVIGSILPDVDSKYSTINNKVPIIGFAWSQAKKIKCKTIYSLFKHRGALTHSWILPIILSVLFMLFGYKILLGLLLGVLSHHILDLFSPIKLRYFYPFKTKIGLFKLPSILETVLKAVMFLLTIYILYLPFK
jgi:membrane-bound metal-dependent hydrolase YbcI (DUF457 family)